MTINDRVKFIGPEYVYSESPKIGDVGVVTECNKTYCQPHRQKKTELVTVLFDGNARPTVLDIDRLEQEFDLVTTRGKMKIAAKDQADAIRIAVIDGHKIFGKVVVNINGVETVVIGKTNCYYESNGVPNVVVDYEHKGINYRGSFEITNFTPYVRPEE